MRAHSDIDAIDEALTALHRTTFQHKAWEDLCQKAGVDLDRAGAALLKTVVFTGSPCRMQDIALLLGIEAPSVTRKVQELEQKGLVARTPDPTDRRVSHVIATSEGKKRLDRLQQVRRRMMAHALRDWSNTDRLNLAQLILKLSEDFTNKY